MIGFFSLATLVYSFKFLWAPLVDRTRVPFLTGWLGHRRSWMLVCQALIMLGLWLVAGTDPTRSLGIDGGRSPSSSASASATQDIAIDAWRIEAAEDSRQGVMAAAYQWGYRIAMIVAGAVPLLLAESYGWNFSYAVMAALMAVGILAVLAAPREQRHAIRPIQIEGVAPAPAREALEWVVAPRDARPGALILGSGLAANASCSRNVLGAIGAAGARDAVLAAWRRTRGSGSNSAAVLAGLRRHRRSPRSRSPARGRGPASISPRRSAIRCATSSRATAGRRTDPGADLPLPPHRLRAEHHEPVLSRPRVHADRGRRGAEDLRRRHVDARRLPRRLWRSRASA